MLTSEEIQGIIFEAIRSGSNANGNWLMFADGTLVQWASRNSGVGAYATWTFPVPFAVAPIGIGTQNAGEGNSLFVSVGTIGVTSLRFGLVLSTTGAYYGSAVACGLLAIGKWK